MFLAYSQWNLKCRQAIEVPGKSGILGNLPRGYSWSPGERCKSATGNEGASGSWIVRKGYHITSGEISGLNGEGHELGK